MKEVLADFVSQSGLDDVNRWSLYHKNKLVTCPGFVEVLQQDADAAAQVDLSLPWRLTGFPNNVTFTVRRRCAHAVGLLWTHCASQVAQRASSAVPVVSLALQLEDGARLQSKFLGDARWPRHGNGAADSDSRSIGHTLASAAGV